MGLYAIGSECCNNCVHWDCHTERKFRGNPPKEVYTDSNCDKCDLTGRNTLSKDTCGMFKHIGGITKTFTAEKKHASGDYVGNMLDSLDEGARACMQAIVDYKRNNVAITQQKCHAEVECENDEMLDLGDDAGSMQEANERRLELIDEGLNPGADIDSSVEFMHMLDSARSGDADAQYEFAKAFWEGSHGALSANSLSAMNKLNIPNSWCRKAAENGLAEAQYHVGHCGWDGDEESLEWLKKAASQGHIKAKAEFEELASKIAGDVKDLLEKCITLLKNRNDEEIKEAIGYIRKASSALDRSEEWKDSVPLYKLDEKFVDGFVKDIERIAKSGVPELQNVIGKMFGEYASFKYIVKKDAERAAHWFESAAIAGCLDAMDNLGICFANGEGVPKSDETAASWYCKAAQGGLDWGQYHYACRLISGEGVEKDLDEARKWLQEAARQGLRKAKDKLDSLGDEATASSTQVSKTAASGDCLYGEVKFGPGVSVSNLDKEACRKIYSEALSGASGAEYEMGNVLSMGMYGVYIDKKEAFDWYLKAAEHGFADAQYEVARFYSSGVKDVVNWNDEEAFKWFWEAATQGHIDAMRKVADCFYYGSGVSSDKKRAELWYARAAKVGDNVSLNMLKDHWKYGDDDLQRVYGVITEAPAGIDIEADAIEKSRFKELYEGAKKGNVDAQFHLGDAFIYGKDGASVNEHHGVMWLRKAAAQGSADAENLLAYCYYRGWGVEENEPEAAKHYLIAADKGHVEAAEKMGKWYRRGICVEKNEAESFRLYMIAANAGLDESQFWVGKFYAEGLGGVERDWGKAVEWYEKSAEQDNTDAICALGWCYQLGNGVEQDFAKAAEWFQKGADNDDGFCMNNLARLVEDGKGVDQDYDEALALFKKAAENDCARANYHIGRFYENGLGCDKDIDEAKVWYQKAADKGDKDAKAALERLG